MSMQEYERFLYEVVLPLCPRTKKSLVRRLIILTTIFGVLDYLFDPPGEAVPTTLLCFLCFSLVGILLYLWQFHARIMYDSQGRLRRFCTDEEFEERRQLYQSISEACKAPMEVSQ